MTLQDSLARSSAIPAKQRLRHQGTHLQLAVTANVHTHWGISRQYSIINMCICIKTSCNVTYLAAQGLRHICQWWANPHLDLIKITTESLMAISFNNQMIWLELLGLNWDLNNCNSIWKSGKLQTVNETACYSIISHILKHKQAHCKKHCDLSDLRYGKDICDLIWNVSQWAKDL